MKRKTLPELIDLIRARVTSAGGQKQFADAAGVSQGYVNDILAGKRAPGRKILQALGYRKVLLYEMMTVIRIEKRTGKIEFKRSDGFWYPMPSEWTFDRKAQEFVFRQGKNRFKPSQKQTDAEYLYGELPITANGEILISVD